MPQQNLILLISRLDRCNLTRAICILMPHCSYSQKTKVNVGLRKNDQNQVMDILSKNLKLSKNLAVEYGKFKLSDAIQKYYRVLE